MLNERSTDDAFIAVSPTQIIAPEPFFSKRKPTFFRPLCSSSHDFAFLMISCPRSWAILCADFSPVAFSNSTAFGDGFGAVSVILCAMSPSSVTTYGEFSNCDQPCIFSSMTRILCACLMSKPLLVRMTFSVSGCTRFTAICTW